LWKQATTQACDKKDVRKEWLENIVTTETVKHILQPEKINIIAKRCVEIHTKEISQSRGKELKYLKRQLAETKKAINNLMAAIEAGIFSKTTKSRLLELEGAQEKLEFEIDLLNAQTPKLTERHIVFMLSQFLRDADEDANELLEEYKRDIIEAFVSEVYFFDDKLLITYNLTNENSVLDSTELSLLHNLDCKTNSFEGSTLEASPPS